MTSVLRLSSRLQRPAAGIFIARRNISLHEYQAQQLMRDFGVPVPRGRVASTAGEVATAVNEIDPKKGEVVVKSQILAGGRGLGTFKSGFKGGVHLVTGAKEAADLASKMLGGILVTKQSGAAGKPVSKVYVAERIKDIKRELYFAITNDRGAGGPVAIASASGGTSIEDIAEKTPEAIKKYVGYLDTDGAMELASQLGFPSKEVTEKAARCFARLFDLFIQSDATLVEVNPLIETSKGDILAADAKISIDDNAAFRQKSIFELRDWSQENPLEVRATKHDLNFIALDGSIGCMVNGAGLAMATMDMIKLYGGEPANFLDVGGGATKEQVKAALEVITADPKVKAIFINIFGGIMRCDTIATGIIDAAKEVDLSRVPLVVRLEGTNVAAGKELLRKSGLKLIAVDDLDEGAKKAVEVALQQK